MKPCHHCHATDPIVYEDNLYCGACNTPYPVYKRVYRVRPSQEFYREARDFATETCEILQTIFADKTPPPEMLEAYNYFKDKAEKYDEWGNT